MNSDVDRAIRSLADNLHGTYGVIFRLFLKTGLAQLTNGEGLPHVVEDAAMALRAVHISVETDEALRVMAFKYRIPRGELVSRVLHLGMLTWDPKLAQGSAKDGPSGS